ncbi:MAG: hypothetical protein ACRCSK_02415 [Fusobacteriaceae bacterium]
MKKFNSSVLKFTFSILASIAIGVLIIFKSGSELGGSILLIMIVAHFAPLILALLLDVIFYRKKIIEKSGENPKQTFFDIVRERGTAFFVALTLIYGLIFLFCSGVVMFGTGIITFFSAFFN